MALAEQHDGGWRPDWATHPGEHLGEYLEVRGWSQAEFARLSGLSKKLISEIINEKNPVSPDTAIILERVLGMKAYIWTGLQSNWDLHLARQKKVKITAGIRKWMRSQPLKELKGCGVIRVGGDDAAVLDDLLKFFGIGSPDAYDARIGGLAVNHRQAKGAVSREHISAWLLLGEYQARMMDLPRFDEEKFIAAVKKLRRMTCEHPAVFSPRIRSLCTAAGVAVVFEPAFSKTRLFGSARWIDDDRAVIQMSLRMKSNDHFWWTFFHESAHIILHRGQGFADDKGGQGNDLEREADEWAEELLVGKERLDQIALAPPKSKNAVRRLAQDMDLHPGILLGMLQHRRAIPYNYMNDLKIRYVLIRG